MTRTGRWLAGIGAALLLLVGDAALTWRVAKRHYAPRAGSAQVFSEESQDPLERFRLEREQLRAMEEAQLNEIIHGQGADAQVVSDARTRLMAMMDCARAEADIEGILRGRGFEDVLASVSPDSANVLVRGDGLTARQTAVILDLVMRQTGLTGGNVKIIPVK